MIHIYIQQCITQLIIIIIHVYHLTRMDIYLTLSILSNLTLIIYLTLSINFTDPYHLYLYCIMIVIDTAYLYLADDVFNIYLTLFMLNKLVTYHFYFISILIQDGDSARNHIIKHNKQDMLTRVHQALVRAMQSQIVRQIDRQIDRQITHHNLSTTDAADDYNCYKSVFLRC